MAHTPGPWEWNENEINGRYRKGSRSRWAYHLQGPEMYPLPGTPRDQHDNQVMGLAWYSIKGTSLSNCAPNPEDARLISASPNMLKALKLTQWHLMTKGREDPEERKIVQAIQAAIAEAEAQE
jgi:hypothetical protein